MACNGWTRRRKVIRSEGGILRLRDRPTGSASIQDPGQSSVGRDHLKQSIPQANRLNQSQPPSGAKAKPTLNSVLKDAANIMFTPVVSGDSRIPGGPPRVGDHIRHIMELTAPIAGYKAPVQVEEEVLIEINGALASVLDKSGIEGSQRERTLGEVMRLVKTELDKLGAKLNIEPEQFADCNVEKSQSEDNIKVIVQFQVCNFINSKIEVVDVAKTEYVLVN